MLKKFIAFFSFAAFLASPAFATEASEIKIQETSLFRDVYEQNIHAEAINQLDLGRGIRKIFKNPLRSANVNVFDEVPDSAFFVNRHARQRMSISELRRGALENDGPDLTNGVVITKGKTEGFHPGFFVNDSRGDKYLFKFDSAEGMELATGAEAVASRIYHALGYYVPQYTVEFFSSEQVRVGEGAVLRDKTGFLKPFTPEKLEESLLFLPQTLEGKYRTSASKILSGENKGYFSFTGRRKNDPEDIVNHRDRREIRALTVFGAWLDNSDIRESNTLDMLTEENGKPVLKHYVFDFNGALGSAHEGPKPPHFGHEYMFDLAEVTKAFVTLGFWEKPWQRRWRENGEKTHESSAVGYFDNKEFQPEKYKEQLPYEAFKRLTRADGFWAAKQIMAFRDDELRAIVSEAKYSSSEDADYIAQVLAERRDLIGKYWFAQTTPLDDFQVQSGKLLFKDLAVVYGFEASGKRSYSAFLLNHKGKKIKEVSINESGVVIDPAWLQDDGSATLEIQTNKDAAFVRVTFSSDQVLAVWHQD